MPDTHTSEICAAVHVTLHAAAGSSTGARPTVGQVAELTVPYPVSFETVLERLTRLPRLFIEPDGSFVWVAERGNPHWQLDGLLFDRDQRLLYLELKGNCTREAWETLLAAVDWPATPLLIQSLREALFFNEPEFTRLIFTKS